jgi:hypothetical protein
VDNRKPQQQENKNHNNPEPVAALGFIRTAKKGWSCKLHLVREM